MDLKNRDLVTIDDLTNGEIESIFSLADEMSADMPQQYGSLQRQSDGDHFLRAEHPHPALF